MGLWFSAVTWRVMLNNSLYRRLQACIYIWPIKWKTWCHPQNLTYTMYCTVIRRGPSDGYWQHVQKTVWSFDMVFAICEWTDRHTDTKIAILLHLSQQQSNDKIHMQEWTVYAGFVQKTVCGFPNFSRKKITYFQNFSRWFLPPHTSTKYIKKYLSWPNFLDFRWCWQ